MARTKFEFDGEVLGFSKLGYAVIKKYCDDNPDTSLKELKLIFPDTICGKGKKCFVTQEDAVANMGKIKRKQFFLDDKEIFTTSDGVKIAVSRLWGNDNIEQLSAKAKELKYVIITIEPETVETEKESASDQNTVYEYCFFTRRSPEEIIFYAQEEFNVEWCPPQIDTQVEIQSQMITQHIKWDASGITDDKEMSGLVGEVEIELERIEAWVAECPAIMIKFKSNISLDDMQENMFSLIEGMGNYNGLVLELTSNRLFEIEDEEPVEIKQDDERYQSLLEEYKTDYVWDGEQIEFLEKSENDW